VLFDAEGDVAGPVELRDGQLPLDDVERGRDELLGVPPAQGDLAPDGSALPDTERRLGPLCDGPDGLPGR